MIAQVRKFQVGLCRGTKESPVRTLDLLVESSDDSSVRNVFLRYYEKKQDSLGFVNQVKDNIVVQLPLEDFALTRELLSGNTDVYFAWLSNADGELVWAEITTSAAPLRSQHLGHNRLSHVAPPHA